MDTHPMVQIAAAQRRYKATPKGKYVSHKINAHRRRIEFELTFEEWWDIWQKSGKWEQRGTKKENYCMLRVGDRGAYKIGNVFIGRIQRRY